MDTPVRTVRIDNELWLAVAAKNFEMMKRGWPRVSVSDIIRVGLMHYLGRADMNIVYGHPEAAKQVRHTEDET